MIATLPELIALVESGWRHVPVLVVGDVMLDQYVWGEVDRISPEAPVPVVRATHREEKPGGAANVAMNLAGLGAEVTLVGFAGGDREQRVLQSSLAEEGIDARLLGVPHVPTTAKLRVISGHQQMMRLDMEGGGEYCADDHRRLLNAASSALERSAVVVLSDYAKGCLTEDVCRSVISEARQRQIPVLVDPKSRDFGRYRGATGICPNRKELTLAAADPGGGLDGLLMAGQKMLAPLELEFMAVTLGEKGIAILDHRSRHHAPAVARQIFDVSGAGDTVIAVLALAAACRLPMEDAARLANVAAGVVVSKVGTVPIRREELLGVLSADLPATMDGKVVPLARLLARVGGWRSSGQRVVFTNGCFDILHVGHIRLLEEARRKGDRLIVGLNTDASVRGLKGPMRPIVSERERAHVLAALSAVDAVVLFGEPTPLRLIEAIRPDVLVKGGDYTEDDVVGAREVRGWGGRVELVPLVEGFSTTRLVASAGPPPKSQTVCSA